LDIEYLVKGMKGRGASERGTNGDHAVFGKNLRVHDPREGGVWKMAGKNVSLRPGKQ